MVLPYLLGGLSLLAWFAVNAAVQHRSTVKGDRLLVAQLKGALAGLLVVALLGTAAWGLGAVLGLFA
ncbi:hypothetical protein AMEJIAPC_00801 [Caulobacter sp. NIBR1757]|nr:hypothetical protein AMEJIAPC_00801 [Caulobacter sp. NIBR1757]